MEQEQKLLERNAHEFFAQKKYDEAYELFRKAALIYKGQGNHHEAALCFASAASCWAMKSGEKIFSHSAVAYRQAAEEAQACGEMEYASLLYRYAAINFERDMEFADFSACFYRSKECYRKFLMRCLFNPKKLSRLGVEEEKAGLRRTIKHIVFLFAMTFSYLVWGHGERPARAFLAAIALIFITSFFYMSGYFYSAGAVFKPDFFQAFYFSAVTFTTVGYGDIVPVGINRLVAVTESFCGLFFIPLFIVALSRKYLRI